MGQGQMQIALDLLKKCSSQGSWLCLKNLHLVTPWLTTLEKVGIFDPKHPYLFPVIVQGIKCIKTT
jgi:dynein heavy chain 2